MSRFPIIFLMLLFSSSCVFSQSYLRITTNKFGRTKVYDVYVNEVFEYKVKGKMNYNKNKVIAMSDSTIMFDSYTEIRLDQIKSLRMHVNNHLIEPFQFVFMIGGIAFLPLNTLNNMIIDSSPAYNEKAAYVSAALITTSFLIKQLGIRRVHLNKKTDFKVLTIDYENLNVRSN